MTCKNCITRDEIEKQILAVNCSWVKKMSLFACPIVERAGPSDNYKLIPSGTRQKDLSSSTNIEDTRLLAVGDSQLDPFLRRT